MAKTSSKRVRKSARAYAPPHVKNKTKKRKAMQSARMMRSGKPTPAPDSAN